METGLSLRGREEKNQEIHAKAAMPATAAYQDY
jgi:hypothetical protein